MSHAQRRYGHREDCTILFDVKNHYVVEQQFEDSRGTIYIVGDRSGFFTTDDKPDLNFFSIAVSLQKFREEREESELDSD